MLEVKCYESSFAEKSVKGLTANRVERGSWQALNNTTGSRVKITDSEGKIEGEALNRQRGLPPHNKGG